MANPSLTNIYEIAVLGEASGQAVNNVLHYDVLADTGVAPNTISMGDLAQGFRQQWIANITPRLSVNYRAFTYTVRELTGQAPSGKPPPAPPFDVVVGQIGEYTPTVSDAGARTGEALPTYCAASIRKHTGFGGREYRGSMRLGPISETDGENNSLTAAAHTAFVAAVNGLLTFTIVRGGNSQQYGLAVFQRTRVRAATIIPPITTYSATVLSMTVNTFLGSQVSRKERQVRGR